VSIINDKRAFLKKNVGYSRIDVCKSYERTYKGKRALALLPEADLLAIGRRDFLPLIPEVVWRGSGSGLR
jgi:hypothetical protein